ncbi:DUF6221 family protein [Streptomyces spectabilis]|uniref:DUF6221 family protein n=1 Tax=Streptomyces spectabilis TaxID=68270 RepID=UPI0033C65575
MRGVEELVQWLYIRLDEETARQHDRLEQWHRRDCEPPPDAEPSALDCSCGVPRQILTEAEAKRRIVELNLRVWRHAENAQSAAVAWTTVRLLAQPYASRLGYLEEWQA